MAESQDKKLAALREQIDALNTTLLKHLNERARVVEEVGRLKNAMLAQDKESGTDVHFYRPDREAEILQRVIADNTGPLTDAAISIIFREIMSACLSLERGQAIAYLGPKGTFTEEAVKYNFGSSVATSPQRSIADVFAEVESGGADYGVVPVENSTEGMVTHTLDSFLNSPLRICGEVILPIRHHLMTHPDLDTKHIQWVSAHQQTLAQCRRWLLHALPGVEQRPVSSNGEAARLAAEVVGTAAIAGEPAAKHYGLKIIESNIQDQPDNTTRFLVLGKQSVNPCGRDKTSIIVSVENRPGALYRLLAFFKRAGINLTRLDTRPSRTEKWAYHFFMEFEGHEQDARIDKLLGRLSAHSISMKRLGSYPMSSGLPEQTQ